MFVTISNAVILQTEELIVRFGGLSSVSLLYHSKKALDWQVEWYAGGDSQGGMALNGSAASMPPLSRLLIDFLAGTRKPPPEAATYQGWYLFIINRIPTSME